MAKRSISPPPVAELEFLKMVPNHGELSKKLGQLKLSAGAASIDSHALFIGRQWFRLSRDHLKDAEIALKHGAKRAVYSRAYYSAYNASKAIRYLVYGAISLRGDDHQRASEIPDDFPDVTSWSSVIRELYENRLRADYDGWKSTSSDFSVLPRDCFNRASAFYQVARAYLKSRYGVFR